MKRSSAVIMANKLWLALALVLLVAFCGSAKVRGLTCLQCLNTTGTCSQKQDCKSVQKLDSCIQLRYTDISNRKRTFFSCFDQTYCNKSNMVCSVAKFINKNVASCGDFRCCSDSNLCNSRNLTANPSSSASSTVTIGTSVIPTTLKVSTKPTSRACDLQIEATQSAFAIIVGLTGVIYFIKL